MFNKAKADLENRMARDKSALFEGFDQESVTYDDNGVKMEIVPPRTDLLKDQYFRPQVKHRGLPI
jgi:hypothetical protein